MHTLIGLVVAAATACAIARPPGPLLQTDMGQIPHRIPLQTPKPYLGEYIMPQFLQPNYFGYEDSIQADIPDDHEWLNKEIDRLSEMEEEEEESLTPFEQEFSRWMTQDPYMPSIISQDIPNYVPQSPDSSGGEDVLTAPLSGQTMEQEPVQNEVKVNQPNPIDSREEKQSFAMTPLDKGYYEAEEKAILQQSYGPHEGGDLNLIEMEPPREIRQNPNLGKSKNLIAENLDRLRLGITPEVPTTTDQPRHIHVTESIGAPEDSIYSIALIAAVGTALVMAIFGFAFGWYTLSKKAKAAADVDYPAYGVTGPNIDTSADRKLAHSAHMYHYQHQKQQIIAMERTGLEQRNGSVSDPESEEENEEGDYTVYECPGFATTGEMEVKNPLFSEEPTPATPGKCELVKPQPKE